MTMESPQIIELYSSYSFKNEFEKGLVDLESYW